MKMKIKIIVLIFLVFCLTGCWDYVGLDQVTIVSGIAIDKDEVEKKYNLTFEYADLSASTKAKDLVAKYIESSGKTVFDAVRNAKRRAKNKLYFANTQALVISDKIAKDGVEDVINWFLRDGEVRETIYLVVAKDDKAKDILMAKSADNPSTAYEIKDIVQKDRVDTGSVKGLKLYEEYDVLKSPSESLALPVFHLVENNKKKVIETYGVGLFNKDKLIGFLDAEDSKNYLFITGCIKGGILPLKQDSNNTYNVSLEISKNSTNKSYKYKKGKFEITIETNTTVYLGEYENQAGILNDKDVSKITKKAEAMLEKDMEKLIKKAKEEYKKDVFGLGSLVYDTNPKLWSKVKKDWNKKFLKSDIKVKAKVEIINSSYLK